MPSKLDDVLARGWLDAMKASSPTHRDHNKDTNVNGAVEDNVQEAYHSWTLMYPSALRSLPNIVKSAKGNRIALFLDYDGTLTPIVDDPDRAFMSDKMRSVVCDVAKYFPTAIISGRSRDKVYELVGLAELHYAGSHGMDVMVPKCFSESSICTQSCVNATDIQEDNLYSFQPAREFLPVINEIFEALADSMKGITGAKVENHKFCVSVHYRCVNEESWDIIVQRLHCILQQYPQLHLCHGRKVLDIRPTIKWDKGKALEFVLDSLGLGNYSDFFPIYIGDDRTDEDAFTILQEKGKGCGILVSAVPKETCALYSLRDPTEVMGFLQCLIKWKMSGDTNNIVQLMESESEFQF